MVSGEKADNQKIKYPKKSFQIHCSTKNLKSEIPKAFQLYAKKKGEAAKQEGGCSGTIQGNF
jgi:hypothetical protein